ncbi:MAG: hypothetical protein ACOZIN_00995 [Myxococcota bacterium]
MANKRKTYYPLKSFDDALTALVELFRKNNWGLVDLARLATDAVEQRKERAFHVAAQAEFAKVHEAFGRAQHERFKRFAAALNAARGAFRNNPEVLAQLDVFKRVRRGSSNGVSKVTTESVSTGR